MPALGLYTIYLPPNPLSSGGGGRIKIERIRSNTREKVKSLFFQNLSGPLIAWGWMSKGAKTRFRSHADRLLGAVVTFWPSSNN